MTTSNHPSRPTEPLDTTSVPSSSGPRNHKVYLLLAVILMLSAASVFSQNDVSQVYLNGHGAALVQVSSFDGDLAVFAGAGAALTINGDFFVGVYGMGLVNNISREDPFREQQRLIFNHGGIWTGYGFFGEKRFQLVVSSLFGFGSVKAQTLDFTDRVFVLNPMLGVQTHITSWFAIELQGGYRIMSKVNDNKYDLLSNGNLSAPFGGLALKFGSFDR